MTTSTQDLALNRDDLVREQEQISQKWHTIFAGAGETIEWLNGVRGNAKRIDNEADALILSLRRARNTARSLEHVARTPVTIGFFGLSQAGKSYLISSLAAGENGKLETHYGHECVDFLEHVNPVGGGKEATGLVTRFSRTKKSGDADFPIELKLFQEIEIAKILLNAYFNDFDAEKVEYEITQARIDELLSRSEAAQRNTSASAVSAEDVVSLMDYANNAFKSSVRPLAEGNYWTRIFDLAPLLTTQERGQLFSVLWGEIEELTQLYVQLANSLHLLSNAQTAFAQLSCLVVRDGNGYSQRDSIMNVDMLGRLGSYRDVQLQVRAKVGDQLLPAVSIPASHIAALTAELIFPLASTAKYPSLNQVDLLDFPGYRGRENFASMAEARTKAGDGHPAAPLVLRGKVAYLFERYTDQQEMNLLVLCANSDKQSDVTGVGPVLERWVKRTQGETAQVRAQRQCGLIWAMTMFDKRIGNTFALSSESQFKEGWESLVHITMLERFGGYDWMGNWNGRSPFNNTYLVRKPGMQGALWESDEQGNEVARALKGPDAEKLGLMTRSFQENAMVLKHVNDAPQAWQAMIAAGDGGMQRLAVYAQGVATAQYKLQQLAQQLEQVFAELITRRIQPLYFESADNESGQKKEIAKRLFQTFAKSHGTLPELLAHLELPTEELRNLYLSGQFDRDDDTPPASQASDEAGSSAAVDAGSPFAFDSDADDYFDVNLFGEAQAPTPAPQAQTTKPVASSADARFAQAVFKRWVAHLRELTEQPQLLQVLNLSPDAVQALSDELITAAMRLGIQERMEKALLARVESGSKREQLVMCQVLRVQTVLRDFIAWFDSDHVPLALRSKTKVGTPEPVFSPHSHLDAQDLPVLGDNAVDLKRIFVTSWLSALVDLVLENAGHTEGREVTMEQNAALGEILKRFQKAKG